MHIVARKKTKAEKYAFNHYKIIFLHFFYYFRKAGTGGPTFEMRWATAEDFMELKVMPRMILDHLPENVYKTLDTVLREQRDDVSEIVF